MTITRKLGGVSQKWYNIVKTKTLPIAQELINEFNAGWENGKVETDEVEIELKDGEFVFTPKDKA